MKSYTSDPMALGDYGPLHDTAGNVFDIKKIRPSKDIVIVTFASVASREQAEALNGTELFVDRSALPADFEKDEYYHADLVGLQVCNDQGENYGTVDAIHNFGAGDILTIAMPGGASAMIPFTRSAVTKVDVPGGLITVDPVAAGLVEIADEPDDLVDGGPARGENP